MTTAELQAIRERCEKTTQGPWLYRAPNIYAEGVFIGEIHMDFDEDRELLIHACDDVPKLLNEVEHMTDDLHAEIEKSFWQAKEIERLRGALETINKHVDSCLDNVNDDLRMVNAKSKSEVRRRLLLREKSNLRQVQITARQALEGDTK